MVAASRLGSHISANADSSLCPINCRRCNFFAGALCQVQFAFPNGQFRGLVGHVGCVQRLPVSKVLSRYKDAIYPARDCGDDG